MPVNATGRSYISDLIAGHDAYSEDMAVQHNFATVACEAATGTINVNNIGVPMIWNAADSAFKPFVANADRVDSATYAVGDIVKLVTQNGLEYVCVEAGAANASLPALMVSGAGGTIVDGAMTWLARPAYSAAFESTTTLPNNSRIAILVGNAFGVGFNKADTALTTASQNLTALFRGRVVIKTAGLIWDETTVVPAADQAEFLLALEAFGITTAETATVVTPALTT